MNSVDNKANAVPFVNQGVDSQLMRSTAYPGPGPAAGNEPGGGSPSVATILQALRRRWPSAISAGIVAAALGVAAAMFVFPAPYTATAVVQLVRPQISFIAGHDAGNNDDPAIVKANSAARVKSPMVLIAALKDVDIESVRNNPNAIKWLETALKTDFLLGPEIMKIALSGDDPHNVATLLNRVVDAFIEESRQEEYKRWHKNMDALQANFAKAEGEHRRKKQMLSTEEQERKEPDEKTLMTLYQVAITKVTGLEEKVSTARRELGRALEELRSLREKEKTLENKQPPDDWIALQLQQTQEGKDIQDRIAKAAEKVRIARGEIKEQFMVEWKETEKELESMIKQRRGPLQKQYLNILRHNNQEEQEKALDKVNLAKSDLASVEADLQKAQVEETKVNPRTRRLHPAVEALRDEVSRSEAVLTKLGETIALLRAEPVPGARVKEWSRAEPPAGRDYSRQIKFASAGGLGMFLLAVAGVCFFELRAGRIAAADEVVQGLGMPVVGTLPPVPARARNLTETNDASGWQSRLMEAVDSIRTFLVHASRTDNVHVVMVTSAGIGEGKTSLASQLAASLARAWKRTLLVDGDLRHPATHALFGVPQEPGFAEVLRGETELAEAIKPTPLSRLWLLPAGHCDAHAVQALAQDNVRTMFEHLKQQYDFIIVDSCPVLPVADSLSLGQHVDGVLYAVLRDVSRVPALRAAQMRLNNLSVRSLGAVLIGTSDVGNAGARYGMLEGSTK